MEDDPDDARTTFRALRRDGRFELVHARNGLSALEESATPFTLGLVDYRLPDMSGSELVRRLRDNGVAVPLVILSAVQSDAIVERALTAGATDFLLKHLTYGETLAEDVQRFLGA